MIHRLLLAPLLGSLLPMAYPVHAQERASSTADRGDERRLSSSEDRLPETAAAPADAEDEPDLDTGAERHRLFPLGGKAAIARGYRIPEPWGLGALIVWNDTRFDSRDLSVAVRKGQDPAADAQLVPLPSVTTERLEGDNRMLGLKGDLWLFPGVNLFASVGKVRGTNRI